MSVYVLCPTLESDNLKFVLHEETDASCCDVYRRMGTKHPVFQCPECLRLVGWCQGAYDNKPELCNDCWLRHEEAERCAR